MLGGDATLDQKLEKWIKWIRAIHEDIRLLAWTTAIYNETYSVVTSNDAVNIPNPFLGWLSHCYSRTALMGLRRQLDHHRDAISMWKLLSEIHNATELVSRANHSCVYSSPERAAQDWGKLVGPSYGSYPRKRVADQIAGLKSIKSTIDSFVNTQVAPFR